MSARPGPGTHGQRTTVSSTFRTADAYQEAAAAIVRDGNLSATRKTAAIGRLIDLARLEPDEDEREWSLFGLYLAVVRFLGCETDPGNLLADVDRELDHEAVLSQLWIRCFTLRAEGKEDEANEVRLAILLDRAHRQLKGAWWA